MTRLIFIGKLTVTILVTLFALSKTHASNERAWQALHDLDIPLAKDLFRQGLEGSPNDLSLMRGLLLAAYFDMDDDTQIEMVKDMIRADPGNPYLMPVFEHVAANLTGWRDQLDLQLQIGQALNKHTSGSLSYTGRVITESYYRMADCKPPKGWSERMGYAPGCWASGPFENRSKIAAYRPVSFEAQRLDTLQVAKGKNGSKAGWTWLPSDGFGHFYPYFFLENTVDIACQFRIYFELPFDMSLLILPGGAYNCRVLIDGNKVYDDPIFRNAVQREGFRVWLDRGTHEITFVLGLEMGDAGFRIAILDTNYQPMEGLKWPRYAELKEHTTVEAESLHPIFDTFDAYLAQVGEEPDTRYWKAVLKIFNGYTLEAVRELEELFAQDDLSLMETWALYQALTYNVELTLALEYLKYIKEEVSTPLSDFAWISTTIENHETRIRAHAELNNQYPNRYRLELMSTLRWMLNQDIQSLLIDLESLKHKYPRTAGTSTLMFWVYQALVNDPESAYREFLESCDISNNRAQQIMGSNDYFLQMRKFDKAISHAKKAAETFPYQDPPILQLFDSHLLAGRAEELIPRLLDLKTRFPYNIELQSMLHQIYSNTHQFDQAKQILLEIHNLKPSAVQPYTDLDSLHNYVSYDSIFGDVDVMAIWDEQPSDTQLGGKNHWYLLDRHQTLVFESGMMLRDVHWATVLLNQEMVELAQETNLDFDPSERFNNLLVARRLRKGDPPLAGTVHESSVIFKDLQPGDAIEIRHRIWQSGEGDLWREFWDDYNACADSYQRYWEYTILTDRSDMNFVSIPPAPNPIITEHCGFNKISWQGDRTPALDLGLALPPPMDDVAGKISVSTTAEWEALNDWYTSVSEAVLRENPRTDILADQLTQGKTNDAEKLRELYEFVVLNIPYQLIAFEYHNSIPHKPDEVLLNGWGDCKDKAHLLIRMLRHVGIQAWPVLVVTRDYGTAMLLPQFSFDHLIACCVIDGDTMFVDPTELPSPPSRSLSYSTAGQPYMLIGAEQSEKLSRLPPCRPEDHGWTSRMRISPSDDGHFDFVYQQKHCNLDAGYRRYELRGYSPTELKKELGSNYSDEWGVALSLDSITCDSIKSVDSVFNETWYGSISLSVQKIGSTTIVNTPSWSTIPVGLLSLVEGDEKRQFPVDLHNTVGRFEKTLEFLVPPHYGIPQLLDPVELEDSLMYFLFRSEWDADSRVLSLQYVIEIEDGFCEPKAFLDFARKVIDTFNSPLLFRRY